jgi:hypothetical protein
VGTTYPGTSTRFACEGKKCAFVASGNYPNQGVPTYFSGTCQEVGNVLHCVTTGAVDMSKATNPAVVGGVWNFARKCDSLGNHCHGSYFGFYSFTDPANPSAGIGTGYNAGTYTEVACPK